MRAVLAVVTAFVALGLLTFGISIAPWFVLGLDRVLLPGRFETNAAYNTYALVAAFASGLTGGWLCATIGRSHVAVLALAATGFVAGLGNHFAQHHKPEPGPRQSDIAVMEAVNLRREPDWFSQLAAGLGVPAILIGGRRALRTRR